MKIKLLKSLCGIIGGCPSVFKKGENYVIVGKLLKGNQLDEEAKQKVGKGEIAIEVPKDLIDGLKK